MIGIGSNSGRKAYGIKHYNVNTESDILKIPVNTNKIGSAWNKAGTWEEKKLHKAQIEDFLNDYIKKTPITYKDSFTLNNFSSFSGDVSILV